jgi:hypothetical protein
MPGWDNLDQMAFEQEMEGLNLEMKNYDLQYGIAKGNGDTAGMRVAAKEMIRVGKEQQEIQASVNAYLNPPQQQGGYMTPEMVAVAPLTDDRQGIDILNQTSKYAKLGGGIKYDDPWVNYGRYQASLKQKGNQ